MLVLSRREGEVITIAGGLVRITMVQIRGEHVRLGIEAPKEMSVMRGEVAFGPAKRHGRETLGGTDGEMEDWKR